MGRDSLIKERDYMTLNINNLPKSGKSSNRERKLVEAGSHMARLVRVIDRGLQPREWQGEAKEPSYQIDLTFEFPHQRIEIDGDSKPMWRSRSINLSSFEKSNCYKWLKILDPNNEARGDFSKLIGTPVMALVVHNEGKNGVFDKVQDIMPVPQGIEVPPLENDPVIFDLSSPDLETFNTFPDWLKEIIQSNLEYNGSKLQRLIEGTGTQYTARAPGDGAKEDSTVNVNPDTLASSDEEDPFA